MSDQRLSVTFGAFSCDVVGYDDPFSILTRVVELFGEIAKSNPAFGAGDVPMSDMEKAKLAAGLGPEASRIDELADASAPNGTRYVVSNAEDDAPRLEDPGLEDDAPALSEAGDTATADEVVIAAEADQTSPSGDLELRDTLEADGSAEPAQDEEVIALDIAPPADADLPMSQEFAPTPEPPLELTKEDETPVLVDAPAETEARTDIAEPVVADTGETEPAAALVAEAPVSQDEAVAKEEAAPQDVAVANEEAVADEADETPLTTAKSAAESAADEIARTTAAAFASLSKTEPTAPPARQPLHLNIGSLGAKPDTEDGSAKPAEAKEADAEPEKPQRRVTITKLPLRPERPKPVEQPQTRARHSLTPVQKVEPVVTFGANFGASAEEPPTPSRAERIRAKMEQRDAEDGDEGENFLFSDVDDAQKSNVPEAADEEPSPLVLAMSPLEAAPSPEETAKKPRRSIANLLGFGKKQSAEQEADSDAPPTKPQADDDYAGDTDGFIRLRESVAAAMPAAEGPTVSYSEKNRPPESISEAIDYDDETSPTAFARRVGANSLQDLLEASAVYMDVVEGKSRFSRRDVMQALNQIGADNDYTQEARLKSFRKLLTTGSLVRVDDGMFTVSQATRFGYEMRMQA